MNIVQKDMNIIPSEFKYKITTPKIENLIQLIVQWLRGEFGGTGC